MARSITDIQADLDAAYSARRTAMQAQEYSLDTGQGRQQVKRANLTEINKVIKSLEAELEEAQSEADGTGVISGIFGRY